MVIFGHVRSTRNMQLCSYPPRLSPAPERLLLQQCLQGQASPDMFPKWSDSRWLHFPYSLRLFLGLLWSFVKTSHMTCRISMGWYGPSWLSMTVSASCSRSGGSSTGGIVARGFVDSSGDGPPTGAGAGLRWEPLWSLKSWQHIRPMMPNASGKIPLSQSCTAKSHWWRMGPTTFPSITLRASILLALTRYECEFNKYREMTVEDWIENQSHMRSGDHWFKTYAWFIEV